MAKLKLNIMAGLLLLFIFTIPTISKAQSSNVTPGVNWIHNNIKVNKLKQSINLLHINLLDPYTTVNLGMPAPIGTLNTVPITAKKDTYERHNVVGAINASFFQSTNRSPIYLLYQQNKLMNLGSDSNNSNDYMYVPAAFGITERGKGLIDSLHLAITFSHDGGSYKLNGFNRPRQKNESILYTNSNLKKTTATNSTGMEVVVQKLNKPFDPGAAFGKEIVGKVTEIRPIGSKKNVTIPKNGFVISAQGTKLEQIKGLKINDQISIKMDVESKWKSSKFIVASGPLLVQNGKVDMTIAASSTLAINRAPRSAVAVDKTGNRVFFVTVDGRQPGHSVGMSLKEFAEYLTKIGAYQALNLDGGGSSTMAIRIPGLQYARTINRPSDGKERKVSSILEVLSSAPSGIPVKIRASQKTPGTLLVGAKTEIKINTILDKYNNLLRFQSNKLRLSVSNGIGKIKNGSFIATKQGSGQVIVKYGNVTQKIPVKVVSSPTKIKISPSKLSLKYKQTKPLNVQAYDQQGNVILFDDSQIHYKVDKKMGSISKEGIFTATKSNAKGNISISLGGKNILVPVEINNKTTSMANLVKTYHAFYEYCKNAKDIIEIVRTVIKKTIESF